MIVLTDQPQNPPYNAFNNSVLKYGSDAGTPVISNVTISGNRFDLFPDATGEFYFNLKRIAQVLINPDHFTDAKLPATILNDASLYLDLEAVIDVQLSDGTLETTTLNFPFLKSVKQLIRTKYANSELKLLIPGATDTASVTYFEGFPFDVSLYSDAGRTLTVTNKRTGGNTSLLLTKGVNRIFISDGADGSGLESVLPMHLGVNELECTSGALMFTLFLKKKAADCGHLLKYFNQDGGWSYWLFGNLHVDNLKTATREVINTDYENNYNNTGNFKITGKDAETSKSFLSGPLDATEKMQVLELFTSPSVYLFTNELSEGFNAIDNFITVDTPSGNYKTGNKYAFEELAAQIEMPKQYTQTL